MEELNCFNIEWNEKISDLERNVQAMEEELINRHQEQLVRLGLFLEGCGGGNGC